MISAKTTQTLSKSLRRRLTSLLALLIMTTGATMTSALQAADSSTPADDPARLQAQPSGEAAGRWTAFGYAGGCDGDVNAITRADSGILYVGGHFTSCDSVEARNIVAYDPVSGEFTALTPLVGSGSSDKVLALATSGSHLYAAGHFSDDDAIWLLARWDGSAWSRLAQVTDNNDAPTARFGNALAIFGNDVYLGGKFSELDNILAYGVARWDGSSWHALESADSNGMGWGSYFSGAEVHAMVVSGSELVIGGSFYVPVGGENAWRVARWNGQTWSKMGDGLNSTVHALLAHSNGDVFAAGYFTQPAASGSGPAQLSRVARWDGTQWLPLGSPSIEEIEGNHGLALAQDDDGAVYVTGQFAAAGGHTSYGIARWHHGVWSALPVADNATRLRLGRAVAVDQGKVYVGGSFEGGGRFAQDNIGAWQAGAWHSLVEPGQQGLAYGSRELVSFKGNPCVGNGAVSCWTGQHWEVIRAGGGFFTMASDDKTLVVGGTFEEMDGTVAHNVALWDGTSWQSLGTGAENGVNGWVTALAVTGEDVYVAGQFTMAGSVATHQVAHWNGSQWLALGASPADGIGAGMVNQLLLMNNQLVAVGQFHEVAGQPSRGLARWNGNRWVSLDVGLTNGGHGMSEAATVHSGSLYVTGWYWDNDNFVRVARFDGNNWTHLLRQSGGISYLDAIAVIDDMVVVGGEFSTIDGQPAEALVAYRNDMWHPIGEAISGGGSHPIGQLVGIDGYLYVAGWFEAVEGQPSKNFARYQPNVPSGVGMNLASRTAIHVPEATGSGVAYELDIENRGASDAPLAELDIHWPPTPAGLSWLCEPLLLTPAPCPKASGSTPIGSTLSLPAGTGVRLTAWVEPDDTTVFQRMDARLQAIPTPGAQNQSVDQVVVVVSVADEAVFRGGFERHR